MQAHYKAALIEAPGRIGLRAAAVRAPGEDEVLVRVEGCGICGSSLPVWQGREWFSYPQEPGAPGHEGWGVVEKVGASVESVKSGDRVALLSYNAFAEYDVAPASHAIALPRELDGLPFPGEALGCAMNVLARCQINPGHKVAVIGTGFLGCILIQLLTRSGMAVHAYSRRRHSLDMAHAMGAREMIPMDGHREVLDAARSLEDEGYPLVIEATGHQWPLDLAGELTAERGTLVVAGYHQDGTRQVDMRLWNWKGIDVVNAHERDANRYVDGIRGAILKVASGELDPSPLYTHRFPLDSLGDGLDAMASRDADFMKGLVIP